MTVMLHIFQDVQYHGYSATIRCMNWPEVSEPIEIDFSQRAYVYRLWNSEGDCLYVGKASGPHPTTRVLRHRQDRWWQEVATADYVEVYDASKALLAETRFIRELKPIHNIQKKDKYDWELWFDGAIWILEHGIHFDTSPQKFREAMNNCAYRWGFSLQTKIKGNTVILVARKKK